MCLVKYGECVALPPPVASFTGIKDTDVFGHDYLEVLRSYYNAVAAVGYCQGGCACKRSGDASISGGEHVGWAARCYGEAGEQVARRVDGVGLRSCAGDALAGGGFAVGDGGAAPVGAGGGRRGGIGESVDANHDDVSCRDGVDAVEREQGRGKHWASNRRKKAKAKSFRAAGGWRRVDSSGGCVSDESVAGTVRTVDTRTGVEIEAARTLAARRIVENQVATELARHKLNALADKSRTEAVNRLAAARYEKQINQAKAASQKSFKQCDESLKSLGSAGSAGEFALKQAVKDARDNEKVHKYTQRQLALTLRYASDDVKRMVSELPPPEFEDELDVFGDCPSDYDDDQRESYYMEINRRNRECGDIDRSPVGTVSATRNEYFDLEMLREKHRLGLFLTEKELVALEMAAAAAS